ncbi:MAG: YaiI/YqxD family protein [Gordonibacter sp.]|uniref:YaiI/YqxD family protein n=1 Tax=Gordonibacter sp. TaxID=1968902 RepID=UPI002FCA65CA
MKPTIYIDADACPVTSETMAVARRSSIPVVIAGNSTQNLARHIRRSDPREPRDGFWASTLPVGVGADAADFAIVQELQPGDIVVTQDIGLAAMALGRKAAAIGVRGRIYELATIDSDLQMRHLEANVRRRGGRTKGPAPFEDDDRERFTDNLQRLVEQALRTD